MDDLEKYQSYANGIMADHSRDIQNQKEIINTFELKILEFQKSIDNLMNVFSEIQMDFSKTKDLPAEFKSLKNEIVQYSKDIESLKKDVYRSLKVYDSELRTLSDALGFLRGFSEGLEDKIKISNEASKECFKNCDLNFKKMEIDISELKTLESSLKHWVEDKILENKPKDLTETFDKFKSEILKKLEVVSLDCQNAILKSSNCAIQLPMIEKKIENILLTLKKYDLSQ